MRISSVAAVVIALLATACSSGDDGPSVTKGETMCREILGDKEIDRFGELVGGDFFMNSEVEEVASVAEEVRRYAREWRPHDGVAEEDHFQSPGLCLAKPRDEKKIGFLSLNFHAIYLSISYYSEKDSSFERIVPINDQVVAELRGSQTEIYFECEISGTHPKQKKDLTMGTTLSYKVPGKPDRVAEFSVNLHAARVMAKALGCQNDVRFPAKLPASEMR